MLEYLEKSMKDSQKIREMKKMELLILGKTKDCTRKQFGHNSPFGSIKLYQYVSADYWSCQKSFYKPVTGIKGENVGSGMQELSPYLPWHKVNRCLKLIFSKISSVILNYRGKSQGKALQVSRMAIFGEREYMWNRGFLCTNITPNKYCTDQIIN